MYNRPTDSGVVTDLEMEIDGVESSYCCYSYCYLLVNRIRKCFFVVTTITVAVKQTSTSSPILSFTRRTTKKGTNKTKTHFDHI